MRRRRCQATRCAAGDQLGQCVAQHNSRNTVTTHARNPTQHTLASWQHTSATRNPTCSVMDRCDDWVAWWLMRHKAPTGTLSAHRRFGCKKFTCHLFPQKVPQSTADPCWTKMVESRKGSNVGRSWRCLIIASQALM